MVIKQPFLHRVYDDIIENFRNSNELRKLSSRILGLLFHGEKKALTEGVSYKSFHMTDPSNYRQRP